MKMKKTLALLTALVFLFLGIIQTYALDINTFNAKLASFKSTQYSNNSTYVNNPSKTGGYQCFGFANELALWIFGSYPTSSMEATRINSGWSRTYGGSGVDNLAVGDIVRYFYHSIFITGISGDNVYYAQANVPSGTNKVTYDNVVSKSTLRSRVDSMLTHANASTKGWVAHCTNGIPTDECTCSTSYAGEYTTKNVNSNLTIRSGHGTNYSVLGSIPANARFTVSKANGSWAHISYNGVSGFVSCEYIQRVASNQIDSRYPTPFKAYCISNDKIPAYDGVNGSNIGNIYGDKDFCEVLEVYTNGWVKVNCPWTGYSNGRIVYCALSVFVADTSFTPRTATAVNKTSAYFIANGTSSPGDVYVGDNCTIVSEQGNQYCIICPWTTSTYTGNYLVWCDKSAFAHTHAYGSWSNYDSNYHARYCNCGNVEKASHTWNAGVTTVYPGCEKAGTTTYTCTTCGATKTKSISATGHSYSAGVVTTAPTCTSTGIKTYTCSNCDSKKTESISALGHSWGSWSKLNDTQHQRVCSRDSSHKETVNHTWDSGSVTTQPTCTGTGVKTYTCTVCKGTKTESVMALGHNWGGWTMLSSTQHQRVCSRDSSHKETASHTWDNGTVSTSPTCTASGVKIYTCTVCKGTKTETVSPIGHDWGAWTNLNAAQHERVCKNDASHKEQANHTWDNGVVTKEPTATESGVKIFTCTVCKATKTEELPITAPDYEPGDINGDGTVNNKDLTRLMKYLAGEDVNVVEDALDVNGDGNVNNKDLTRLMKYLAGEDVSIS